MGAAIGLAALLVVLGLFAPRVLEAMQNFLTTFFTKADSLLQGLELKPIQ